MCQSFCLQDIYTCKFFSNFQAFILWNETAELARGEGQCNTGFPALRKLSFL